MEADQLTDSAHYFEGDRGPDRRRIGTTIDMKFMTMFQCVEANLRRGLTSALIHISRIERGSGWHGT
jgi:hypothetical protein